MALTFHIVNTDEQLEMAYSIRREVFIEEQQVPEDLELDEYDATATHFLVMNDRKTVGTARFRPYDSAGTGKVERVAVLASERGKGTGAALMLFIEEYAKEQGYRQLKLNAQIQAKDFYERLGYVGYGDLFLDAGIEHISMQKKLD